MSPSTNDHSAAQTVPPPPSTRPVESGAHLHARYLTDRIAGVSVWAGGVSVIGALMLIFFYLLSEIWPLFIGAKLEPRGDRPLRQAEQVLYTTAEEQGEVGLQLLANGHAQFIDLHGGELLRDLPLPLPSPVQVREVDAGRGLLVLADDRGQVLLVRQRYRISYPNDQRRIEAGLEYPYGERPMPLLDAAPRDLAVRETADALAMTAIGADGRLHWRRYAKQSAFLSDEVELSLEEEHTLTPGIAADRVLMDPRIGWMYLLDSARGELEAYRIGFSGPPQAVQRLSLGEPVVAARFLAGGVSTVYVGASGRIRQFFPVRAQDNRWQLAAVREFELPAAAQPTALGVELRRRGFAVGDAQGRVHLFHATSGRHLASQVVSDAPIRAIAYEPRAKLMLVNDAAGRLHALNLHNEHPEVSFSALWTAVWYEGYDQPELLWQASAANSDFEPKFSLTPLAFGTLKAAFYAMLFALPLAILGAIFTANFMSPQLRQWVKPTVELMEALPTVILGFLAGLWLAPFVERELAGVFLLLILLPLSIPLAGYAWQRLPRWLRYRVPPGWEAALLVPVILLVGWAAFALATPIELLAFGGNLQAWMDREYGIGYDQRNAMVVGIAMGVAVIPTIFSIAEDAIFSVPKHLSLGSLALGATAWQTLVRVVLPTASPAIFSAVMIGIGRAVGETMIVLMATGNTPVMDFSLFQGMRTLSANIAVEMPESEVGSTHFRLLFLAGFVLFVFTFFFNTAAEMVRQHLRRKYASL